MNKLTTEQFKSTFINHGKRWTKEENDNLLKQVSERKTLEDISNYHKRTTNAIWLQLLNLAKKIIKDGKTIEDVSKLVNISVDRLNEHICVLLKNNVNLEKKDDIINLAVSDIYKKLATKKMASIKYNVSEVDISNYFKTIDVRKLIIQLVDLKEKQNKQALIHQEHLKFIKNIIERQILSKQHFQEYTILKLQINELENKIQTIINI